MNFLFHVLFLFWWSNNSITVINILLTRDTPCCWVQRKPITYYTDSFSLSNLANNLFANAEDTTFLPVILEEQSFLRLTQWNQSNIWILSCVQYQWEKTIAPSQWICQISEEKKTTAQSNIVTFYTSFNLQPTSFILSLAVRYPNNAEI